MGDGGQGLIEGIRQTLMQTPNWREEKTSSGKDQIQNGKKRGGKVYDKDEEIGQEA